MVGHIAPPVNHHHVCNICGIVRSNTCYVHLTVTPSAAWELDHRLHPHVGIKGCGATLLYVWGSRY